MATGKGQGEIETRKGGMGRKGVARGSYWAKIGWLMLIYAVSCIIGFFFFFFFFFFWGGGGGRREGEGEPWRGQRLVG